MSAQDLLSRVDDESICSGVYAIVNYERRRHYIGSTVKFAKRWRQHRNELRRGIHRNAHLQNAWNKYGEREFYFEVLERIEDKTQLLTAEQRWLDLSSRDVAMNIMFTATNTYGQFPSLETRAKMSRAGKGRKLPPFTEEHRRNISLALTGKKLPPQTAEDRAKKSVALMGNQNARGATRSPETRARMSAAQKLRFAKCV